ESARSRRFPSRRLFRRFVAAQSVSSSTSITRLAQAVCTCVSALACSCTGHVEGIPDAGDAPPLDCAEGLRPVPEQRSLPLRLDFEDVALDCTDESLGRWSLRSD